MKALVLFVAIILNVSAFAHDPTEITYVFQGDQMTINLTPKGALDLITVINPELANEESMHLSHYLTDYEVYFNDHIDIQSGARSIRLQYEASDLTIHDSFIRYRLLDFDQDYNSATITVTAFEDVYSGVRNEVVYIETGEEWEFTSSENKGFEVLKEKFIEFDNPITEFWLPMILGIAVVIGFIILILWGLKKLIALIF